MRVFDGKPGSWAPAGRPWVGGWREGGLLNLSGCTVLRFEGRGKRNSGMGFQGRWTSDARCVCCGAVVDLAEEVSGRKRHCAVLKELFRRFILC